MSFDLINSVKGLFTNEIISKAASSLGESEGGISKAISGIVPTVISSIASKASSGNHGAINVLQLTKDAAGSGFLGNLGTLFTSSGDTSFLSGGFDILKSLFGDKLTTVLRSISDFAGIGESSASTLMSAATPAALSLLGQHAQQTGLTAGSLTHMLDGYKSQIARALPAGLGSLAGLLGIGSISGAVKSDVASVVSHAKEVTEKPGGSMKFLLPLLLGILTVILLIYLFKGCNGGSQDAAIAVTADTNVSVSAAPVSIKVKLPNGVELDAYKGGIEDQLVTFLQTDYAKLGEDSLKKIWFDFDNLNFNVSSAEITPESQHQIDNIAAILKAFPKSKVKIGGYTDKTGNEELNKKLSKERAEAVKAALEKATVGAQLTGADGYGSDFAKYAADAPEKDRVHDRHVSVSVRL